MPPTRMLVKTNVGAASTHSATDSHERDAALRRPSAAATRADGRQALPVDVVERDLRRSADRSRVSPPTSSGVRTPAPPMTAIFMVGVCAVRALEPADVGAAANGGAVGNPSMPPAASVDRAPTKLPRRRHSRGGCPASQADEEAAVEGVAGAGRIDDANARRGGRRRRSRLTAGDPAAAARARA